MIQTNFSCFSSAVFAPVCCGVCVLSVGLEGRHRNPMVTHWFFCQETQSKMTFHNASAQFYTTAVLLL